MLPKLVGILSMILCVFPHMTSVSLGQTNAPLFDPQGTIPQFPHDNSPGLTFGNPDYLTQTEGQSQLPIGNHGTQQFPNEPPPFAPLSPDPFSQYAEPGYEPNGYGCDPIGDLFRKTLGLDQEPDYFNGYYDPFSTQFAYGATGVTPYQLRWQNKQELAFVPTASVQGVNGEFGFTEFRGWSRYAFRVDPVHVFAWTLMTNKRFLSGPSGVALGPDVNLIQSDFQLASNYAEPLNWQIGVTPQMNSDFQRQLTRDAYMVDARAVILNRLSPQLTLALGIAYWDRNHGHIIPYGGVIWTPDDRWEIRAMFPKSRISYFAGSFDQADIWFYGSAEYTLDAYQVTPQDQSRIKQRMELQDYRFMLGVTALRPRFGSYVEGGYITDRHVNFRGPSHDFGIGDVWTIRAGVTF